MLRVVLCDDERLAIQRLRQLLAPHPNFQIVGEASTKAAAYAAMLVVGTPLFWFQTTNLQVDMGFAASQAAGAQSIAGVAPGSGIGPPVQHRAQQAAQQRRQPRDPFWRQHPRG